MSTWTQTSSSPFTRLSLVGKGQSAAPRVRPVGDDDYIPYTGPYEQPPPRRQERNRDSWGDPLYEEDANDVIQHLHERYVPPDRAQYPWRDDDERKSRPRARTHSGVSGRTVSSGTVDPHRASVSVLRKASSHHPNTVRPPVPSYINLDAAGGVGDSPAPPPRFSRDAPPPKRSSLASLFTFGQASKKLPVSPAKVALPTSPLATAKYGRLFALEPQRPASGPPSIYSVSSDKHQSGYASPSQEGDAYHSYHNFTPAADQFGEMSSPRNATPPPHPYAYGSPHRTSSDPPQTAPLVTSPKLKFTHPPHARPLKTYASTPNLRETSLSPNRLRDKMLPPLPSPKGKDRWLSAETWCDAVMFPRPRLKAEDAQLILRGASGRIVSPPGSPILGGFNALPKPDQPEGMVSRVLAHSRSMVSLNAEAGTSRGGTAFRGAGPPLESPPSFAPPPVTVTNHVETPPRPKSFAWDDLALPSPVPSLARVLEEGQILEHQRKKWQTQATASFQNTRARSLSRSRAKSLTQRGGGKAGQSNLDFLAARSLLGNQDVVPVVPTRLHARTASQSGTNTNTNGTSTFNTRTSHSHSNSLVKTMSKSSHGHSRQESWGRSALHKAAALCYVDGVISPVEEKTNGLESALRTTGTKVIRLADPAMLPADIGAGFGVLSPRNGVSPTPSAVSDAQMGIALGTPPVDNSSFERESIHLPSHPYAQGGVTFYPPVAPVVAKGAEYAGPHPAVAVVNPNPQDFSARHRLPPQATLTNHPYAAPSSGRNSYQVVPRTDSDVPPASKMWAQLSPGFVREILPGELLYSPFMSERSTTLEEQQRVPTAYGQKRKSTVTILDTVGLGEALANAVEEEHSRDSGLGTSEDHAPHAEEWADEAAAVEAHHPYRIHRKPVQYDVSRPPYTPKKSGVSSNTTNHTAASSPVDPSVSHDHLTAPTPPLPSSSNSSPGMNSLSSSPPRSPPPVGSVDDLDDFRDLFYKPNLTDEVLNNLSRPTSMRQQSITWDIASTTRTQRTRTGSGLTSLARQLSQEFEEMKAIHHRARTESMASDSSISRFSGRFPTENDIQFIFSDSEMSRSVGEDRVRPGLPEEAMSAFRASGRIIPEDVEASRTSLDGPMLGEEEDDHDIRVGNVETVSTPPAMSTDYRNSYTGQMLYAEDHAPVEPMSAVPRASHLQPHSADPTRSSYMTESDFSRMSNLSDFPAPPPQHMTPAHMSLLSSYFHDAMAERPVPEDESVVTFAPRIGERF